MLCIQVLKAMANLITGSYQLAIWLSICFSIKEEKVGRNPHRNRLRVTEDKENE